MMTGEMRCAKHPNEMTNLQCSRCSKPVCVRCMVYTPVGIRCRECATQKRSGIYAPSAGLLLKAAATGVGIALVAGVVWGMNPTYAFWIALVLGFAGGELVSLAANRRRGPELQAIAAGMVVVSFLIALALASARNSSLLGGLPVFQTVMAALAMVLAVVRQR